MNDFVTVSDMVVRPLYDGPLPTTLDKIPVEAHRAEAEALIEKAGAATLVMNVYAFLVSGPDGTFLVDAGAGPLKGADLGRLPQQLARFGVTPADIDAVFMTHLHTDHFGGLIGANGPALPNADIIVYRREAEFWLDTPESDLPARARRGLDVLRDCMAQYSGRVRYVGEEEVRPGIRAIPAHGHSHGHVCWRIGAGSNALLAWGDLIHIAAIHLPAPHIAFEYDLYPEQALESRLRILDQVGGSGMLIAGAHLPSPGIGRIVRAGDAFAFEPANIAVATPGDHSGE